MISVCLRREGKQTFIFERYPQLFFFLLAGIPSLFNLIRKRMDVTIHMADFDSARMSSVATQFHIYYVITVLYCIQTICETYFNLLDTRLFDFRSSKSEKVYLL
jgi:hypothetical protein